MKVKLIYTILAVTMLIASTLTSAEIIPVWNKLNEAGIIHDMEFLRGENQFILLAGLGDEGEIQLHDTQSGELVSSFQIQTLGQFNQIEITPDSNQCIITTGGNKTHGPTIELRNLSDYSIISKDSLLMDGELKDPQNNPFFLRFHDILVDPVKPLVYVVIEKTNFISNYIEDSLYLKVYNYETMELVKDLTPVDYETEELKCFDVSDDGKYLAALNDGKAYLKVWDLETYELIKDYQLYDDRLTDIRDYWCEALDIEFSSLDDDLIYYSGIFPNKDKTPDPNGIFRFSKENHNHEILNLNNSFSGGLFCFFDDEKRIFNTSGNEITIINQEILKIEFNTSTSINLPFGKTSILKNDDDLFIGHSNQYLASIKYDSQTNIENNYKEEIIITPNPTASFVNINLECLEPQINYQINSSNGGLIKQSIIENQTGNIQIDFSPYPTGVYFITITCGNELKSYKVVRE